MSATRDKTFAIVIVCYKRVDGVKRLLSSLELVDFAGRNDIALIVDIDFSGSDEIASFAFGYEWPHGEKRVVSRKNRMGLKSHVLSCGDYTEEYDVVVVLEDDTYVSDSMYRYAYSAAVEYWDDEKIAGISLFGFQKNWLAWHLRFEPQKTAYDAYFMKIAQSWGEVWTAQKWRPFREWLKKHPVFEPKGAVPDDLMTWGESSWLKYHDWYCMANEKYFVYPYVSLSTNFSDPGEHSKATIADHQVELQYGKRSFSFPKFTSDAVVYDEYMNRCGLGQHLDIDEGMLTVDFWGTRREREYRRYVLTTKKLPFRIVKSFALALRPIELNIIQGVAGEGIWLFDTAEKAKELPRFEGGCLDVYSLRTHDYKVLLPLGLRLAFMRVAREISDRFGR